MKKILYLFIGFLFLVNTSQAQNTKTNMGKPIIIKASYFDVSPPLRDIVQNPNVKVDKTWKEGIVINKSNVHSSDSSFTNAFVKDPIRQNFFGKTQADTTIQNYEGIPMTIYLPPDTDGDVGPNNYFQEVNVRFAIYDKNGNKLIGPLNNSSIFSGMPNNSNDGDGIVLYDQNADRWLFSQFSLPNYPNPPSYEMVAISQTGDPTGSWYRYQFTFSDEIPDYPKLAGWGDAYYMTIRRGNGGGIVPAVVAMERTKMIAGDPAPTMIMFNLPSEGNLAADCDSDFPPDGTPCPICLLTNGSSASIKLYEFHTDWDTTTNSTLNLAATIPISPFSSWGWTWHDIPQKGTSVGVDAFSRKFIMHRMPFRKFSDHWSMLLNTTVKLDAPVHSGIRWMELRNSGSGCSLYQEGTYAPDSNYRWMGSIAMDTAGNIALGYSISSSTMFPSIRYTGRMSCDPLGVMTIAERGIYNGGGSQTDNSGRWGDYSAMVADPTVFGKFWYTQEYYQSTAGANWKTRIASFSFADILNIHATATPSTICSGQQSQLNVIVTGGSGTYTYSWTSIPQGDTSTQQNPLVTPTITTKYIVAVNDGTITKTDTTTVTVTSPPAAYAGPDTTYANTVPLFIVSGTASSYSSVKWLTSGDGYFNIDTVLTSLYYPGPVDRNNGGVDLTLQAYPNVPCTDTATDVVHITLTFPAGISDNSSDVFGTTISPNPTNGLFTLVVHGIRNAEARITITDLAGKEIYSENGNASTNNLTKEINLAGYPKGTYFVKVLTDQHSTTNKLVLQ
ncbi:MAG: T9SS type A sorting domain-containing protein [Bacteroidales bacterium]